MNNLNRLVSEVYPTQAHHPRLRKVRNRLSMCILEPLESERGGVAVIGGRRKRLFSWTGTKGWQCLPASERLGAGRRAPPPPEKRLGIGRVIATDTYNMIV